MRVSQINHYQAVILLRVQSSFFNWEICLHGGCTVLLDAFRMFLLMQSKELLEACMQNETQWRK